MIRLSLLLLAALGGDSWVLRLAPDAGTRVVKSVSRVIELDVGHFAYFAAADVLEQPVEARAVKGISCTETLFFADTYLACAENRPIDLVRSVENGSSRMVVHAGSPRAQPLVEIDCESVLRARPVRFVWDGGLARYAARAEGEDADEISRDLELCRANADLSRVLPPGGVEPGGVEIGDSWDVPPDALADLLLPGGDFGLRPKQVSTDEGIVAIGAVEVAWACWLAMHAPLLSTGPEGTAEAWCVDVERSGSKTLVVLALEIELHFDADVAPSFREHSPLEVARRETEPLGILKALQVESVQVTSSFVGSARIVWDVEGRRLHAYELEAEVELACRIEGEQSFWGYELGVATIDAELAGTLSVAVVTE